MGAGPPPGPERTRERSAKGGRPCKYETGCVTTRSGRRGGNARRPLWDWGAEGPPSPERLSGEGKLEGDEDGGTTAPAEVVCSGVSRYTEIASSTPTRWRGRRGGHLCRCRAGHSGRNGEGRSAAGFSDANWRTPLARPQTSAPRPSVTALGRQGWGGCEPDRVP